MSRQVAIEECGCCEHYHRVDFYGDCRDDAERIWPFDNNGRDDPRYVIVSTIEEQMAAERL